MTEEEYIRMRNLLDAVVEQQGTFAENQRKADERHTKTDEQLAKNAEQIARNTEGIAALLAIAQIHEQEMTSRFKETDDRINALVDVVERYITKGQ
jgi:type VI protein secretion system component VasK